MIANRVDRNKNIWKKLVWFGIIFIQSTYNYVEYYISCSNYLANYHFTIWWYGGDIVIEVDVVVYPLVFLYDNGTILESIDKEFKEMYGPYVYERITQAPNKKKNLDDHIW